VTGDTVYGRQKRPADLPLERQFLHATSLALTLPDGTWHEFVSPLPADLESTLAILRERSSTPVGTEAS